jgi:hypothetical protein
MGPLTRRAFAAAVAAGAIAPASAIAAPPIVVSAFSLSPSCTHPGGTVTATDTLQTTTNQNVEFYAESETRYFGTVVMSTLYGPYITGPNTTSTTVTPTSVPWYAPFGSYNTVFGVGPSAGDALGWSSRSADWSVTAWPFC